MSKEEPNSTPVKQVFTFDENTKATSNNKPSGLIKPKYLKDKSVFYKTSGYLRDLLGEDK